MNVIPVINCETVECVAKKIEIAKTFLEPLDIMHLDVTDGVFSTRRSWGDPTEWMKLNAPFYLEVHLMVQYPEEYIESWATAGARRFILHAESLHPDSMHEIISMCQARNISIMLSTKPGAISEEFLPYLRSFNAFQVLAVEPGPAGQKFLPFTLEKVRFLRDRMPDATIEVDGGMTPETAAMVRDAGADTIVSSSYIFDNADPKAAYISLKNV